MYKDLKVALDEPTKHLKFNNKLFKELRNFRITWMQKSPDYIDFLGGKNLGVHPIRFSSVDDELLFVDILNLDMDDIRSRVYNTKGIDKNWKISSNPYYNVLMYMCYRFYNSKDINKSHIEDAVTELFIIYYYKVIGSLLSRYFQFNVSEDIAKATVERLSNKSLIKRLDNWQEVIEYSAKVILPKGIHYDRIRKFNGTDPMTILNDTQGRIRDIFKKIYVVMLEVVEDNEKITKSSLIKEDEDGSTIVDVTNRPDKYISYCNSIISNRSEFLNDEIIKLVSKLTNNKNIDMVKDSLGYISDTIKQDELGVIEYIIVNSIEHLNNNGISNDYINNIVVVIKRLKGFWSKNPGSDKLLKKNKEYIINKVKNSTNKITSWKITSTTTTILVYIFIRSIINKK